MKPLFRNRRHAGQVLARQLPAFYRQPYGLVLGLARSGVPVAYEVALALELPLDIFVVRRLGLPGNEERSLGAIASGGIRVFNTGALAHLRDAQQILTEVVRREETELHRREKLYRNGRALHSLRHRTVLLVDDGLATGAKMHAAVRCVRVAGADRCIVAAPVGSPGTCHEFEAEADEIICASKPEDFQEVGQYYEDFAPTTDEEVHECLEAGARRWV